MEKLPTNERKRNQPSIKKMLKHFRDISQKRNREREKTKTKERSESR